MKRHRWKEPAAALLFLLLSALLVGVLSAALRPARVDYGAVWGPYLAEPEDSLDYLYLGSSYAYCDVDPGTIYAASGLTGYVLAGPEQTLSQTYWYLREALKTQSPSLVVLEASALEFARYQNYTQVNVGYMPFGLNKLGAIFTASEPELRTGLLFDLYFYHSRWKEVTEPIPSKDIRQWTESLRTLPAAPSHGRVSRRKFMRKTWPSWRASLPSVKSAAFL